jgi:sugar O-acyltransferase (sialic acid O-acetyltransferase NeuD family)
VPRQRIVIIGAGGHARVIIDAARLAGHEIVGVLSRDARPGADVLGCTVLGKDDDAKQILASLTGRVDSVVVAIGDNHTRAAVVQRLLVGMPRLAFATVVHPSAIVSPTARIGYGTVVLAGAVVGVGAHVGNHCIVNTAASVDHDDQIEDFASIAPGAVLGGTVRVGTRTAVCLGAKVIQGIDIGSDAVIGAGATVVRNVANRVVVMGTPARVVREHVPEEVATTPG